jgi:hypothetical protein
LKFIKKCNICEINKKNILEKFANVKWLDCAQAAAVPLASKEALHGREARGRARSRRFGLAARRTARERTLWHAAAPYDPAR